MLSITFAFYLQALISEVNKIIIIFQVVHSGTSAEISMLENINSKIVGNKCPYSYVKFSIIIKEWFLNVLLHDPKRVLLVFLEDKLRYISHVLKNFDTSALIERSRFY